MMENTTKLLDEIAKLKDYKHQVGKALARIENWDTRKVSNPSTQERITEKQTLEAVLRIFDDEVNK